MSIPRTKAFGIASGYLLINGQAIGSNALVIFGTPVDMGTVGSPYAGFTVAAFGGTGPYTYSLFSGALPPPVVVNPSTGYVGAVGNLTTAGTYAGIVIGVTDSLGATAHLPAFDIVVVTANDLSRIISDGDQRIISDGQVRVISETVLLTTISGDQLTNIAVTKDLRGI